MALSLFSAIRSRLSQLAFGIVSIAVLLLFICAARHGFHNKAVPSDFNLSLMGDVRAAIISLQQGGATAVSLSEIGPNGDRHSWRVGLLSALDMLPVLEEYRFDLPPNSHKNLILIDGLGFCPFAYERAPDAPTRFTSIMAVVSEGDTQLRRIDGDLDERYAVLIEVPKHIWRWNDPIDVVVSRNGALIYPESITYDRLIRADCLVLLNSGRITTCSEFTSEELRELLAAIREE